MTRDHDESDAGEGSGETARSQPDGAAVTVTDLSLSFDSLSVLDSLSLQVAPGEFVGLVGPNGAGKTTLLQTVSAALSPTAGRVTIADTDVHRARSRAVSRLVAVVPQDTALSFSFPVKQVVEMGRYPHRSRFSPPTAADRQAVEQALERTDTAVLADRPIDELSGGQRQRVVLARAIAQETPVLLLDEPTASLDVNHQVEMLSLVRGLADEGRTVLAAIHDLDLAARYCDRLALLADGEIKRAGRPETVLTAETLSTVFEATAAVSSNPITQTPTVTTLPDAAADRSASSTPERVHLIGAGPVAATALARLVAAGVDVSVGPVPEHSVVDQTVEADDVDVLRQPAFAQLSPSVRGEFDEMVTLADVLVSASPGPALVSQLDLAASQSTPIVTVDESETDVQTTDRVPTTGTASLVTALTDRAVGGPGQTGTQQFKGRQTLVAPPEAVVEAVSGVAGDQPAPREADR